MKQFITLICVFVLTSFTVKNKVRFVYIQNILKEATKIRSVKIYSYKESFMFCGIPGSKDTLKVKATNQREVFPSIQSSGNEWAGSWPSVGEIVLLILKNEKVILFAKPMGTDYRFWDPNSIPFANSIFMFPNELPYKPLAECLNIIKEKKIFSCTDGCLVLKSAIKEHG